MGKHAIYNTYIRALFVFGQLDFLFSPVSTLLFLLQTLHLPDVHLFTQRSDNAQTGSIDAD